MDANDVEAALAQLHESRLLSTREEFNRFEDAIARLASVDDYRITRGLSQAFDDGTHEEEVMFGLVHLIEHFQGEDALKALAQAIPGMIPQATDWAKLLHKRILNHAESRSLYNSVLRAIDPSTRDVIVALLRDIARESPDRFKAHVEDVIGG